jgi:hypothetical protein
MKLATIWLPLSDKTEGNATILRHIVRRKMPIFVNKLNWTDKTAKPLCVGSIPTRASKILNIVVCGYAIMRG